MIIRDTPDDLDSFYMTDGETAFKIQQRGICPLYMDNDAVYFKKTHRLLKLLKKISIDTE